MNKKNLANAELLSSITDSQTTIEVKQGQGSNFPAAPYYITVTPLGVLSTIDNSEIMMVTSRVGDTLTVTRGMRASAQLPFSADSVVVNGVYIEDLRPIVVTVATAANTAAKVGTTDDGVFSKLGGDEILVRFINGSNVNNPTLNVDGTGAHSIRLGNTNVTTVTMGLGSGAGSMVEVPMWFDGTYYRIYGSHTGGATYSEISEAEIDAGTASTLRTITGRRSKYIMDALRAEVAAAVTQAKQDVYPVGSSFWSSSDSRNPSIILGFGTWTALDGVVLGGVSSSGPFNVAPGTIIGADTHTLTVGELPNVTGSFRIAENVAVNSSGANPRVAPPSGVFDRSNSSGPSVVATNVTTPNASRPDTINMSFGGEAAHNNVQRTKVGYLWERTA